MFGGSLLHHLFAVRKNGAKSDSDRDHFRIHAKFQMNVNNAASFNRYYTCL